MAVDWTKVPPPDAKVDWSAQPPPEKPPEAIAYGARATPDLAVSAIDLSRKTGYSPEWVTDNHEEVKAEHELREFGDALGSRPITREWASDSTRAAAVKDDMGPLGRIESLLSWSGLAGRVAPVVGGLQQGVIDIGEAEAMREHMGSGGPLADSATGAEEEQKLYDSKEHGYPEAVSRAAPAMGLYAAATVLGGGVGLAALLYAQNKGVLARRIQLAQPGPPETGAIPMREGQTAEMSDELTPEQVDKYATAGSAVSAVLLAGLMTPLLKSLPGAREALESVGANIVAKAAATSVGRAAIKALGAWGVHTLMGATGMALQGVVNEGTVQEATAGKLDGRTLAETGVRDFVNSLPVMATFAAYGPARDFLADRGRINAAIANGATLDDLVASAKESALRRRSAPLAEELFGMMGRGVRAFIDWKAAQKVEGLRPEAVAEAEVTQSSVPVPIEEYLARHADDHDAIRSDVKTEANGYTPNEARKQLDNMKAVLTPEEARTLYGAIPPDEQVGVKIPIAADLSESDARRLSGEPNPDKTIVDRPATEESPPLHEIMAQEYGGTPEEWAKRLTPDLLKRLAPPKVSPDHAAAAEQALRQKPIGDIQPGLYKQAAQRAADALTKQAIKSADLAAKRGQESKAVVSRMKEAGLEEARDAARARAEKAAELRDFYDRAFDKLSKNAGSATYRAVFQKAHVALGAVFDGIMQAIGAARGEPLKNPSELLPEALGAMRESNTPVTFDIGAAAELLWKGKPWNSMLPAEADHVVEMVKNLRAAARNRLTIRGEELDAAANAAAQDASVLPAKSEPLVPGNVPMWQKVTQFAGAFNARALERLEILKSMGPTVKRLVVDRYYEAAEKEDQLARGVGQKYVEAMKELPKEMQARRFDSVAMPPELALAYRRKGLNPNADRQFLWTTALMWGDGQARARYVQGLGGERGMSPGGGPFENMVTTWLTDSMNPQEWQFVSKVGGLESGKLWAELKAKEERKSGTAPVESQKAPIYDRDGNKVADGWYFPLKRDRRAFGTDGGAQPPAGPSSPNDFFGPNYTRPSVQHRFVKERAEQAAYVVDLNWNRIPQHIAEVIHDIAFDEPVTDAAKLLLHPKVDAAMKERLGMEKRDQVHAWLYVAANERAEAATGLGAIQTAFSFLRNRTQSSALGNSLPVIAAMATHSLLSLIHGEVRGSGAIDYVKAISPSAREFALENSEALRQRSTSGKRQLQEDMGLMSSRFRASTVGRGLELAAKIAQFGQDFMDTTLGVGLFNAKYNEVFEKTHDHDAAAAAGNDLVRANLQPREPAEKSMLMNDKGAMSAILIFHGFFNKVYNKAAEFAGPVKNALMTAESSQERLAAAWKTAEASGKFLALLHVLALGKLALGRGREQDESWLQWYIRTVGGVGFDLIPLASNLTQPIIDRAVSGKARPVDFRAAPALAGLQKFTRSVQDAANENKEDQMWKAVDAGVMAAGAGSGQYVRTAKYLSGPTHDLERGRLGSFIHGSMYGEQNQTETFPLLLENLFGGR